LHGYGVGYGMLAEAKIANLMGLLSSHDYNFIIALLSKLGINASYFADFTTDAIVNAMRGDKKNTNQEIKLVLLTGIGIVKNIDNQVAFPVSEEIIITALNELKGA
jgi:3-dehydroquinate synthetase